MTPKVDLAALNRDELAHRAPDATVLVPVGATEQHGPRLPLGVDARIAESIALASAARLRGSLDILVSPTLHFGYSDHHLPFGAISLSSDTLVAVARDIAGSLAVSGFRRIAFLNAHGGNAEALPLAVRDVTRSWPVSAAAIDYWKVAGSALTAAGLADRLVSVPGHAGSFETALMLELAPEEVGGPLPPEPSAPLVLRPELAACTFVQHPEEWTKGGGYSDSGAAATPELGRAAFEIIVREVAVAVALFHEDHPA